MLATSLAALEVSISLQLVGGLDGLTTEVDVTEIRTPRSGRVGLSAAPQLPS
jgi:hypothetical protein